MEDPPSPKEQFRFPWRTAILAATLIVICGLALFAYLKTAHGIKHAVDNAVNQLPAIAAKFKTGTITQTFRERIPEVSSTRGDILEIATSRSDESFTRSDTVRVLWDKLDLGTTVSEIRVPVTFRYHLRLSDTWRLAVKGQVCLVVSPPIHPSLPPAIHTDQMEKSTRNGWARFNKDANLATLERSITPMLDDRAGDPQHLRLVRETCRQSVADFVKKWLLKEGQWRSDRFSSLVVVFPDEATFNSDQELEQYHYAPRVKFD